MSDELRDTFFLECFELLEVLESGLLDLVNGDADDPSEVIAAVFRAVHSVKGGAGAFALEELVRLAHRFETALDEARENRLDLTPDVLKVFLTAADALSDRVRAAQTGDQVDQARESAIIAKLNDLLGACDTATEETEAAVLGSFEPLALDLTDGEEPRADAGAGFEISLEASAGLYARGGDVTRLLRALAELGEVTTHCETGNTPLLDHLNLEEPVLRWRVLVATTGDEQAIREIFEFSTEDCDIEIVKSPCGADPDSAGGPLLAAPALPSDANDEGAAVAALDSPKPPKQGLKVAPEAPKQTIRVDLSRIEQLINLVGELVINQAMLAQRMGESEMLQDQAIADGLDEFRLLTRDIQESVMAIRAQPVKPLFQRMARIVREAAHATGKDVRLATSGEWTEVDKTIVERLSDPLTHMIRNAVDHGLETAENRVKAGKAPEGVVTLAASHRSGRIIIDVGDDGAGINRPKVRQIAIDKGLIPPDAQPTDAEIDNLLFAPGFSTASEVSDLSGRGVGMDVVKKAIQALGGRTSISSRPGHGTNFSISLPLTLAVLDGIVVSVADQTAVLPLSNVIETLRPAEGDLKRIGADAFVILVRGEPLPVIDVGRELGFRNRLQDPGDKVFIVVENHEADPHALVVDDIHDQRQVVIKGLEANYGETRGVSAATILGDGRIALILDVDVLVDEARIAQTPNSFAMTG